MAATQTWTTEEFLERRFDLPEGGQWAELINGQVVHFEPPNVDHGTVILNLSKAFAAYAHQTLQGYACFDLGLQLQLEPDTVRFPAACYFIEGRLFAEADKPVTDVVPALVVEVASSADRLRASDSLTEAYLDWGVSVVWTIDVCKQTVDVAARQTPARRLTASDRLLGAPILEPFQLRIADLFAEPEWWLGASKAQA